MSEWIWAGDDRPAAQLQQEIRGWVAGGSQLASIRAVDTTFEVWTANGGYLVVDAVPAGAIGYAMFQSYPDAIHAVAAEVLEQEVSWRVGR